MRTSESPIRSTKEDPFSVHNFPMPPWKRAVDLVCCLIGLPVLAVCTLIMTLVTSITSPGPVFFTQERVGLRGRRFLLYKFRTMKVGADSRSHQAHLNNLIHSNAPMMKLDAKGDRRMIPGAWILRASGFDELPQLINVLKGEMSLIGPRPCIPYEYEEFTPGQRARFNAVPGLTGLWQVSGKNRTTFDEMIRLDVHYATHLSPWLDLKILLRTPWALLIQVFDSKRRRAAHAAARGTEIPFPARNSGRS